MFNRLKDGTKITDQDPSFKARYIGYTETFTAAGRGCTTPLVQRLWDNAEEERFLKRVHLKFTTFGIHLRHMDKKKVPERLFPIENISFCNVDIAVNDRIFTWICREADDKLWECHAVVCSSPEKAKSMALVLTRLFHIAYKEWRSTHTREIRTIERYKRAQSLPPMTLTKKSSAKQAVAKQQSLDTGSTQNAANNARETINGTPSLSSADLNDSMTETNQTGSDDKSEVSSCKGNNDALVEEMSRF